MSHHRGINWDEALASFPHDATNAGIARALCCDESTVRRARKRRGMASPLASRDSSSRDFASDDAEPITARRSPTRIEGAAARVSTTPSLRNDDGAYAPTFPASSLDWDKVAPLPPLPGDPRRDPWMHEAGAPDGYHLHGVGVRADGSRSHQTRIGEREKAGAVQPTVPSAHYVKGVSTLLDANGAVAQQWVKTDAKREAEMTTLLSALSRIAEPLRGERDPTPVPRGGDQDLLVFIPYGDPHLGAFSWPAETGEAWDLEIAERVHVEATQRLIDVAPLASRCHLALLGDNLHANDDSAQTPKHHHQLDVDNRFPKVLDVAVRTVRRCIDLALAKFPEVDVTILRGNHDPTAAVALEYVLAAFYEREPRVYIDKSPAKFRCLEWGQSLIGLGHGDTRKLADMNGLMPALWPKAWGRTRFHYWLTGHVHSDRLIEFRDGCLAESMRTLAAKDAYAAAGGWTSGRDLKLDVIHRERGRIMRHYIGVESLSGAA